MAVPWIVVVCRGVLICLPPVAAYLFAVARRYGRPRPVVRSGAADFFALLAGLSGFLLAGGVLVLGVVRSDPRLIGRGHFAEVRQVWAKEQLAWAAGVLLYVGGGAAAVAVAVRRRSGTLSVTGADPAAVDRAVSDALAAAGAPAERFGSTWAADKPLAAVDHTPLLAHSTVRVLARDPRLGEEIARHLSDRLAHVPPATGGGPGVAFGTAGAVCLGVSAVAFGLLAVYEYARA